MRDRSRAQELADRGFELHEADVLDAECCAGPDADVEIAYYLIHSMGRGARGEFEERSGTARGSSREMAKRRESPGSSTWAGWVIAPQSTHLRSRHGRRAILAEHGPPLTYFRAGMVVGAQSESYRTLRYLVQRLPAMIGRRG